MDVSTVSDIEELQARAMLVTPNDGAGAAQPGERLDQDDDARHRDTGEKFDARAGLAQILQRHGDALTGREFQSGLSENRRAWRTRGERTRFQRDIAPRRLMANAELAKPLL